MSAPECLTHPDINNLFEAAGLLPVPIQLGRILSRHSVSQVDAYPSPGNKKVDDDGVPFAFRYPGQRPETSFAVVNDQVESCVGTVEDRPNFYLNTGSALDHEVVFNLDDLLKSAEAPTMAERYPVIAFGSNANPGQLAQKFEDLNGADQNIVPTIMAKIKGVVPGYAARIGINGYIFTDLFPADQDVESRVHVNFLSPAQLEAMDATERAYGLCEIAGVGLETHEGDQYDTTAYLYVGRSDGQGAGVLTDGDDRPIRLAEISATGSNLNEQFAVMSQAEAQRYIYEIAGEKIADNLKLSDLPKDEVDLVKLIINRKDEPRLDSFRRHIKEKEDDQPLGRMVGRYIQKAISATGRTTQASGLREVIPRDAQDISIKKAKTFGELSNK